MFVSYNNIRVYKLYIWCMHGPFPMQLLSVVYHYLDYPKVWQDMTVLNVISSSNCKCNMSVERHSASMRRLLHDFLWERVDSTIPSLKLPTFMCG